MSIAAAKRAAAALRGSAPEAGDGGGQPVELIFKTKEQRKAEEEQDRKAFLSSNPMNI